jgi:hypothetical protein
VEEHLQQEVAQFVAELIGVVLVQGGKGLIGFLQQVGLERGVGLNAVPGTAVGPPQAGDDPPQPIEGAQFGDYRDAFEAGARRSQLWAAMVI